MKGIMELTEKNWFRAVVGVVNVCLIFGLIIYLIVVHVERGGNGTSSSGSLSVVGEEYTEEDIGTVMDEASGQMASVYYTLIQGSYAEMGDGTNLQFGIDGNFSGFFDMSHPDVSGYTYEVLAPSEEENAEYEANVNIYNEDKSSYVQYKLLFDENSNMQLYYPASKTYIPLSF